MNRTVALVSAIVILLVCSYLTRVSDEILKVIVVEKMEQALIEDPVVNELLLVDLAIPSIRTILEDNVKVRDIFFYKLIDTNGIITGKYVSVFGRIFNYDKTEMNINLFSLWYQNNTGNNPERSKSEALYQIPELYTTAPFGRESYKVVQVEMAILYTDGSFEEKLKNREEEVVKYLKEYFSTQSVESITIKDGEERVKEEILAHLVKMFETDESNFTRILFTEFSVK